MNLMFTYLLNLNDYEFIKTKGKASYTKSELINKYFNILEKCV
jgi:hypothetical protein